MAKFNLHFYIILLIFINGLYCNNRSRILNGRYNEILSVTLKSEQETIYWFDPLKVRNILFAKLQNIN